MFRPGVERLGGYCTQLIDRLSRPDFAASWKHASRVRGWTGRRESGALFEVVKSLPENPVIVEVGSFLGRSAITLGWACRGKGGGRVYCVDPFDASGDAFSKPVYETVMRGVASSQWECFHQNLRGAGIEQWVEAIRGTAATAASSWTTPIDLLFLDGDQSPAGMREAFESFAPFLKLGATLAVHNSAVRHYEAGHDGGRRLVEDVVREPAFSSIRTVDTTTIAVKSVAYPEGLR